MIIFLLLITHTHAQNVLWQLYRSTCATLHPQLRPIHQVKVLRPTWHKTGHFGEVLPSQSLGLVLKN